MAHQYSQDAIMVDGFYTNGQSDTVRNFVDNYRMIFNTEPELMAAFAFDTANILIDLLSQPQMQMRHHLRNQLKQMPPAEGVTGATAFAPDGEAIKRLTLLQIKGDRFIEISRP
jgi:branched-chain amino acid transport system substrate-binding protein